MSLREEIEKLSCDDKFIGGPSVTFRAGYSAAKSDVLALLAQPDGMTECGEQFELEEIRQLCLKAVNEPQDDVNQPTETLVRNTLALLLEKAQPETPQPIREPDQQLDPQWQCGGCANWWPGWKRLCDMCGKTFWCAKVVRGECEKPAAPAAVAVPPNYAALYAELIYEVATKYPGESRHETARRYIREREQPSNESAKAAATPAAPGEPER